MFATYKVVSSIALKELRNAKLCLIFAKKMSIIVL